MNLKRERELMKADFKATAEWRRHFAATACDGYQHAEAAKILDKLAATVDYVDEDLLGGYLQVCDGMLSSGFRLHEERLLRVGFHIWLDTATEFVQPDEDGLTFSTWNRPAKYRKPPLPFPHLPPFPPPAPGTPLPPLFPNPFAEEAAHRGAAETGVTCEIKRDGKDWLALLTIGPYQRVVFFDQDTIEQIEANVREAARKLLYEAVM